MKKSQIKWYNEVIKKVNITQTGKRERERDIME